jgi:hypothetical protein
MSKEIPLIDRIEAFSELGKRLGQLNPEDEENLVRRVQNQNSWFAETSIKAALRGISIMLERENLENWLSGYSIPENSNSKVVGILMAGNIPGVGFHDLLTVLISGNSAAVKLSSADSVFSRWLIDQLVQIEPRFEQFISIEEMLKGKDAYIATGSDNSARYFNYYFGKYPSIIRANRTSVAVLTGAETAEDLENLGWDIFLYYGLGCRNVSKIFVKNEGQLLQLLDVLEKFSWVASNHKYLNNYEYNKSIYLVNREPHLDNGFLILRASTELVSPIGVLYYEFFENEEALKAILKLQEEKIQCIVGNPDLIEGAVAFGQAQYPGPGEYADRVDTLKFLLDLR